MIVAMDQPTKTDLRMVKEVLAPKVLRALDTLRCEPSRRSRSSFLQARRPSQAGSAVGTRASQELSETVAARGLRRAVNCSLGQVTRSVLSGARSSRGPAQLGQLKCAAPTRRSSRSGARVVVISSSSSVTCWPRKMSGGDWCNPAFRTRGPHRKDRRNSKSHPALRDMGFRLSHRARWRGLFRQPSTV